MTQDTSPNVLVLSGDRCVRQAVQTHDEVLAALRAPGDLVLDCAGITGADLSFVQIILAAHRSARSGGCHVSISAPPEGALRNVLDRGGFVQTSATDPACWISGGAVP